MDRSRCRDIHFALKELLAESAALATAYGEVIRGLGTDPRVQAGIRREDSFLSTM